MTAFPGFDRRYELHDPLGNRAFRGKFEHENTGFELSRSEESVSGRPTVRWAMGTAVPGDIVWTTSAHPLVVSNRVLGLLSEHRVSGWSTYDVRMLDKYSIEHHGYAGLVVTGRCGVIDLRQSALQLRQLPGGHFPEFVGHFFEPSSWDGSDFSVPVRDSHGRASSQRIATDRVVKLFKRNRVTNVRWVRLSEVRFSTANFEIGLQHLLPPDFDARIRHAYREASVIPPERYRDAW